MRREDDMRLLDKYAEMMSIIMEMVHMRIFLSRYNIVYILGCGSSFRLAATAM